MKAPRRLREGVVEKVRWVWVVGGFGVEGWRRARRAHLGQAIVCVRTLGLFYIGIEGFRADVEMT